MNRFLILCFSLLSLTACDAIRSIFNSTPSTGEKQIQEQEDGLSAKEKQNRCITHNFSPSENLKLLYGLNCVESKELFIETSENADRIPITTGGKLRLEKAIDGKSEPVQHIPNVINQLYKLDYQILSGEGDEQEYSFLKELLNSQKDADFVGSTGTTYRMLFETQDNYLVIYKSSKNIEDIPYTERSSLDKDEKGNYIPDTDGYYNVPFVGYKIEYCLAQIKRDELTNKKTNRHEIQCKNINKNDQPDYIKLNITDKVTYDYFLNEKKNMFPVNYFFGEDEPIQWLYGTANILTGWDSVPHFSPLETVLIEFEKGDQTLDYRIVSDLPFHLQNRKKLFTVEWKDYKRNNKENTFGEIEEETILNENKTYVQINFDLDEERAESISDFIITENYFSYVISTQKNSSQTKKRISLLRADTINQNGFKQRRYFQEDQDHIFSVLDDFPQTEQEVGEHEIESREKIRRLIKFNTNEEETVIPWYFSKDSSLEPIYRDLGRQAIAFWNKAFAIITEDYCKSKGLALGCKSIRLELREGDKDLGDLRYNILNLVNSTIRKGANASGWLGVAPSYIKDDTGQILGTTSNVFIHNVLNQYTKMVNQYIRYEIFRKKIPYCKDKTQKEEIHTVSPHIQKSIRELCKEVEQFICSKVDKAPRPRESFNDSDIIATCAKEISKENILSLILHEMGHSFGLGHNFKASVDKNNYYSLEEIEEIWGELGTFFPRSTKPLSVPKISSVMDYTPSDQAELTVPGKYDLAVLRYLYMDQIETKDYKLGERENLKDKLITLDVPEDTGLQKPLKTEDRFSERKNYASCAHRLQGNLDFLCLLEDYGSSPLEIVSNWIDRVYGFLANPYFYSNDFSPSAPSHTNGIQKFYDKWIAVRNKTLDEDMFYAPFYDTKAIKDYQDQLKAEFCKNEAVDQATGECLNPKNEDYDLYYPIRQKIADFYRDILLINSMKCEVTKSEGETLSLDLNFIKEVLLPKYGDQLYVEDCQSTQIQEFFRNNAIEYIGQKGYPNFKDYYSQGQNFNVDGREDLWAIEDTREQILKALTPQDVSILTLQQFFITKEPDFLQTFLEQIENKLLYQTSFENLNQRNINSINTGFSDFDLLELKMNLDYIKSNMRSISNNNNALNNRDKITLLENYEYLHYKKYDIGTQTKSFYTTYREFIKRETKKKFDNTAPFLNTAYEDWDPIEDKQLSDFCLNNRDVCLDSSNRGNNESHGNNGIDENVENSKQEGESLTKEDALKLLSTRVCKNKDNTKCFQENYIDCLDNQNLDIKTDSFCFQEYLLTRRDVLDRTNTIDQQFIVPILADSLIAKLFKKYNETLEMEIMNKPEEELTELEKVQKKSIEAFKGFGYFN